MLKNFKLPKIDHHSSKSRISSSDISAPTQISDISSRGSDGRSSSTRYVSDSSNMNSPSSYHRHSPSRSRNSTRHSHHKDLLSPEKVIKAKTNFKENTANGISFNEGDFFYVIDENDQWFEALNPSTGIQGLVPREYFEVFDKKRYSLTNRVSTELPGNATIRSNSSKRSSATTESQKMGSLYAIVLYDFKAEKPDELTSYVGENLFICAHHNYEWFIAKPIGRLGGPGLVPVGFVSIIDIKTGYATGNDVKEDIDSVHLPTIQEWKRNVAKYKASNIALGQVDHSQNNEAISHKGGRGSSYDNYPTSQQSVDIEHVHNVIIDAAINSFKFEDNKYWFLLECQLSSGKIRYLKRYYQDFYDLQVQLLDNFPSESGKLRDSTGKWTKRIIPYIPGPVPYVTDSITSKRKDDLNIYVKELIKLPAYICDYIAVRYLFTIRSNGYDREEPIANNGLYNPTEKTEVIETDINGLNGVRNDFSVNNPNNEDNTLTVEDLNMMQKMSNLSISSPSYGSRPPSVAPPPLKPVKIKFYYKSDIIALMLDPNITYNELFSKIASRISTDNFKLQVQLPEGGSEEISSDEQVSYIIHSKLKISVHDLD